MSDHHITANAAPNHATSSWTSCPGFQRTIPLEFTRPVPIYTGDPCVLRQHTRRAVDRFQCMSCRTAKKKNGRIRTDGAKNQTRKHTTFQGSKNQFQSRLGQGLHLHECAFKTAGGLMFWPPGIEIRVDWTNKFLFLQQLDKQNEKVKEAGGAANALSNGSLRCQANHKSPTSLCAFE